ncbi:MAG: hypothetical protein V4478_01080 [Patescibacteria group bacterium]
MKITPFQLALKNELSRLEQLTCQTEQSSFQAMHYSRPIKSKSFLLQLFGYRISF